MNNPHRKYQIPFRIITIIVKYVSIWSENFENGKQVLYNWLRMVKIKYRGREKNAFAFPCENATRRKWSFDKHNNGNALPKWYFLCMVDGWYYYYYFIIHRT